MAQAPPLGCLGEGQEDYCRPPVYAPVKTEKYTMLQGVYSIQWRIPCSTEYTHYRGGYPAPGSILNTGKDTLLQGAYLIQGRIPCSREYTQYREGYPALESILNIGEYTLLQGVYSIQGRIPYSWGHTNSILGRIPCSREYTHYSGGYPTLGSIFNTGEDTLLQGVYSIQWRKPCSRGYI